MINVDVVDVDVVDVDVVDVDVVDVDVGIGSDCHDASSLLKRSEIIAVGFDPSAFMTQIEPPALPNLVNSIFVPSGDHDGVMSFEALFVSLV